MQQRVLVGDGHPERRGTAGPAHVEVDQYHLVTPAAIARANSIAHVVFPSPGDALDTSTSGARAGSSALAPSWCGAVTGADSRIASVRKASRFCGT